MRVFLDLRSSALLAVAVVGLAACASPARSMAPAQIANLSDYQLCRFSVGYRFEPNTEAEIARRGLVCTPETVECMGRGLEPHDPAMGFCVTAARLQNAADMRADEDAWRRDDALREYGDNANAKHFFVWN